MLKEHTKLEVEVGGKLADRASRQGRQEIDTVYGLMTRWKKVSEP